MMFWSTVLFAASILVSQSAMDFFGALMFISVVIDATKKIRSGASWKSVISPLGFEWVWAVWLFTIILSFVTSPLAETHWAFHLFEFKWIILLYTMGYSLRELRPQPRMFWGASIFLGVCSAYAIFVWFLGRDPIHPSYNLAPWVGGRRTGGLLSNAMVFGHVYGAAFCLWAGAFLMALWGRLPQWKILALAVILTGFGVLFSFTRGAWMGCGFAVLAMAFFANWRWGVGVTVLGSAAVGIATQLWPTLQQRFTHIASTGDERQWIWAGHWRIFLDHPWTGVGYGENYQLVSEYYRQIGAPDGVLVSHAHNQYLHFLAGTGVLGLLAYLLVLFMFFRLNWRVYQELATTDFFRRGLALGCLGVQVFFFVGGITEANLEHSKMKSVLIVTWGIVAWLFHERQRQEGKF